MTRSSESRGGLLSNPKKYSSVAEMVRDTAEDKEQGEELAKKIEERNIVSFLVGLRISQDLSQGDIAQKIGCSQSKVSKLESGIDKNLSIGDFAAYVGALGFTMGIQLYKKSPTIVERIKTNVRSLRDQILKLAALCIDKDQSIRDGAIRTFGATARNLATIMESALDVFATASQDVNDLPPEIQKAIPIQADEDDNESPESDSPSIISKTTSLVPC